MPQLSGGDDPAGRRRSAPLPETCFAVHVDCDNLWIYEDEFGEARSPWQDRIYDQSLPQFLELFAAVGVKATFFVIGDELLRPACRRFCAAAVAAGHQIGNHSSTHTVRFAALSAGDKRAEIERCHADIAEAVGARPIGFRAPGYYLDRAMVEAVLDLGYRYDTTVLPGLSHHLMRTYQNMVGGETGKAFGRWYYALVSRRPRRIDLAGRGSPLIEVPIATLPLLRFPVHTTFVYMLGKWYWSLAIAALQHSSGHHPLLFHAIDLLDHPPEHGLSSKVPALRWPLVRRKELVRTMLVQAAAVGVMTTEDFIEALPAGAVPSSWLYRRFL